MPLDARTAAARPVRGSSMQQRSQGRLDGDEDAGRSDQHPAVHRRDRIHHQLDRRADAVQTGAVPRLPRARAEGALPAAAPARPDPAAHPLRRAARLAGHRPVARGQDGQHQRRQGPGQARQHHRLLPRARTRQDRRAPGVGGAGRDPRRRRIDHAAGEPAAVARPPARHQGGRLRPGALAAARHRPQHHRGDRRERRPAHRRQADGDQLLRRRTPSCSTSCS